MAYSDNYASNLSALLVPVTFLHMNFVKICQCLIVLLVEGQTDS